MLKQYHIFVGILAISLVTGLKIKPEYTGDRTFLEGAKLLLICSKASMSNQSDQLSFTSGTANISTFTSERSYEGGVSMLTISKMKVTTADEGTYVCSFDAVTSDISVAIKVYKDTQEKTQKHFKESSSDYIDGETLKIQCPILDSLIPEVTWTRDLNPSLEDTNRASYSDFGNSVKNGELSLKDLTTDDRGYYVCTASWYSGNATFKHLVRVKSHLAPLWPAIGIILEIIALVVIVLLCKDGKKNKDSVPLDSQPASASGSNEKGNRRKYATSST